MVNKLKILPKWFEDVAAGKKNFEIRYNDRNFRVGDILVLKEYENGTYTGREVKRKVNYILYSDGTLGLSKDYCILGLEGIAESEDCIKRAKALEVIKQMDIPEDMSVFEIKSHIGVEIGTLPPAMPKRKVGEWIKKNNDYFDWYECSECGYGSDGEMKYNRLCDVRTKFCPDCGSQNLKGE